MNELKQSQVAQKYPAEVFYKKSVLKNFTKLIQWKMPVLLSLFY